MGLYCMHAFSDKINLSFKLSKLWAFFPSVTYNCFIYRGHWKLFRNETKKKRKCVLLDLVDYLPEQGPNVTFNLECVFQLPRFFLFCFCSLKCTNNLALF
jgi:hypothetical protein